jgi:hypothetical protein
MEDETAKLTVRLPKQDVEFAKAYARAHGLTVTEVIDRYLRRMRSREPWVLSAEVEFMTALVPADVDTKAEYQRHLETKHR